MNNKETIYIIGLGWGSVGFIKNINTNMYVIHIISDNDVFSYTPLLAQNIKQNKQLSFTIPEINEEIKMNKSEVDMIDFTQKMIITKHANKIPYTHLIFAHGSTVNTFDISGVNEHTLFLKTAVDSERIKAKLLQLPHQATVAVIGCGPTGSEIIGSLLDYNKFQIVAIDALPVPLSTFDKTLSNMTIDFWNKNFIKLYLNKCVSTINSNTIHFKGDTEQIHFDLAIWCAGIKPSPLTESINKILQITCSKGIPVDKYLQVANVANVYAIGDCAFSGHPPTAQVAYQQGKYLASQFNNRFSKQSEFKFQSKGQICYIGKEKSVFQNSYFKSGGNITYYLNKAIHIYYLYDLHTKNKLYNSE
jgi:NADH:ubiquinone reductase (non-electrogenic)